jgi:hypothetical protein
MFSIFGKKSEEKVVAPSNLLDLMNTTTKFVGDLRSGGGFGYVLFGSGLLLVVSALLFFSKIAEAIAPLILPLGVALVAGGTVVVVVERIIAYRLAMLKLRMILEVTQRVVLKAVESDKHIDTAVVRSLITETLGGVWGLWIPADTVKSLTATKDGG